MDSHFARFRLIRYAMRLAVAVSTVLIGTFTCRSAEPNAPSVSDAVASIRAGDLTAGGQKLLRTIHTSSTHAGHGKSVDFRIASQDAAEHGRKQLEKMLNDRPAMRKGGAQLNRVHQWAIIGFSGGITGFPVDWDSNLPAIPGAEAEHFPPTPNRNAYIRIVDKIPGGNKSIRNLTSEELWHHLAFEFLNLRGTKKRRDLYYLAINGAIDRRTYIEEMFRIEHSAVQLTHLFYAEIYLPAASSAQMTSTPKFWYVTQSGWWGDSSEFAALFPRTGYPWADFGQRYDKFVKKTPEDKLILE